jgi:hypothetical protein
MTTAALDRIYSLSIRSAPDLHRMRVAIISLTRKVSRRVAIHAAGMPQDGNNIFERSGRSITHCRSGLRGTIERE